jgi:hypothetical protein
MKEGLTFPKVGFNCLGGHYQITLEGIDIFERANEHLKLGVIVLKFDEEFEDGELSNKRG